MCIQVQSKKNIPMAYLLAQYLIIRCIFVYWMKIIQRQIMHTGKLKSKSAMNVLFINLEMKLPMQYIGQAWS